MDPAPEITGGAAPDEAVSGSRTPESEKTPNPERAQVIGALENALRFMNEASNKGALDQEKQFQLKDVQYAKSRTLDAGKTYFMHEPVISEVTGKKYRYQERIPTDGILLFLDEQIRREATKIPSKRNNELLEQYRETAKILADHSRSFQASQRDPDRFVERVRLEAQLISQSERDTGDPVKNWLMAEKAMSSRYHLIIPRETITGGAPSTTTEPAPTPESTPPDTNLDDTPPGPGEPGFIGPVLPPAPGEPGFIGPVLPESETSVNEGEEPDIAVDDPSKEGSEAGEDVEVLDNPSSPGTIDDIRDIRVLTVIGSHQAGANKFADDKGREYIIQQEAITKDLGDKAVIRAWNILKYRFTREGFQKGKFGLMRDKHRYAKSHEVMDHLVVANTSNVNETVTAQAAEAATYIKNLRSDGKEIINRTRAYIERGQSPVGEEISDVIEGPFRDFVTETLLYGDDGILEKIRSGADEETLQPEIQKRLFEYVSSHQDDETIRYFFGQNDHRYGEISRFYATDLVETAKEIQRQAEIHSVAVEMLKNQVDIRLVKAQQGKASEIEYTRFEKLMELSQKNRLASWALTPTRAGVLAAAGTIALQSTARRSAMITAGALISPWAVPVVGIAVGVGMAMGRENQRFKSDTLDRTRDFEQGIEANEEAKYGRKIDALIHPLMVKADQLLNGDSDGDSIDKVTQEKRQSVDFLKTAQISYTEGLNLEQRREITMNLQSTLSRIAEIESRLSAPNTVDTKSVFSEVGRIQYDKASGKSLEAQRTQLAVALVELRDRINELPEDQQDSANEILERYRSDWNNLLIQDREAQEKEFTKARLKRALGQGAKMGAIGVGLGIIGQEALASAARYVPGADALPGFNKGQTATEKVFDINENKGVTETTSTSTIEKSINWTSTPPEAETTPDIEKFKNLAQSGQGSININEQYRLNYDSTRGVSIIDSTTNEQVLASSNVNITPEGKIQSVGELPSDLEQAFKDSKFGITYIDPSNSPIEHTIFDASTKTYQAAMGVGPDAPLTQIPEGTIWIDGRNGAHTLIVADRPDVVLIPDAKIIDGEFTWDKNYTYPEYDSRIGARVDGLYSQIKISTEGTGPVISTETKPILGENGEWERINRSIDTREWYSYDQPGSQGNELKLHTHKQGNGVVLDMSHMNSAYQNGLEPNPINVQEVIQNKESGFYFSLPGLSKEGVWVPDGADGEWDGKLFLNPEDTNPEHIVTLPDGQTFQLGEFSKIVLNEQALANLPEGNIATELYGNEEVFALGQNNEAGFIEAGRITNQNNQDVLQAFATIRGAQPLADVIEKPGESIPVISIDTPLTEKLPIIEITPPQPVEDIHFSTPYTETYTTTEITKEGPPPIIPIGFAPRETLEPVSQEDEPFIPPGYEGQYYGGASLEGAQSWLKSRPHAHKPYTRVQQPDGSFKWVDKDGKEIVRSVNKERDQILSFLNELKTTDPNHYTTLERLLEKWQTNERKMKPMSNETRVSVNIPAWMEGKRMYEVLQQYTQQVDSNGNPLDPKTYEINIIVNRKTGSDPDNSVAEIERFISDTGEKFQINYIDVEFDPPFNTVGNARRVLTNLTLMRSIARPNQTGPLYIESEDADLDFIDPKTVTNIIHKLDENPYLDAVRGIQDRNPDKMMANDYVFLYRRMQDFKEMLIRRQSYRPENNPNFKFSWNRVITGGWNSAYTAEAYALIGGYPGSESMGDDRNVVPWAMGEDMVIGERISMARGNGSLPNTQVIGKVSSRSDSSPRRYIYEAASGQAAYGPDFENESVNDKIREMTPEELLLEVKKWERIDTTNQGDFEQMLNSEYNFIRTTTPNLEEAQEVARMALLWLGFKRDDYEFYDLTTGAGITENRLRIKNISNVKAALENYRLRHPSPRQPGERTRYNNRPNT